MYDFETQKFEEHSIKQRGLIIIERKSEEIRLVELNKSSISLGRDTEEIKNDISLSQIIVSRIHGCFTWNDLDSSYYYTDLNSLNGTFINGVKLKKDNDRGTKGYKLKDGDIIRIDCENLNKPHENAVTLIYSTNLNLKSTWKKIDLSRVSSITIGRSEDNDIQIKNIMVSRNHAFMKKDGGRWYIIDKSKNGVYLNNELIEKPQYINERDVIRILDTNFIYLGYELIYNIDNFKKASLQINIKDKKVFDNKAKASIFRRKTLLKDINLSIDSGEMILILGGSGAGKSTLMEAILGVDKANGKIIIDGLDLYKNYNNLKYKIGYVPQKSRLRDDKIFNLIEDAALLNFSGRGISKKEIDERVIEVMKSLGIYEFKDYYLSVVSGGQKRRVDVAVPIAMAAVTNPSLFFVDEPDSGLDYGNRRNLMKRLKDFANEGKIVMAITHSPDEVEDLFSKILVLAKSKLDGAGHVAFFGNISEAKKFFQVKTLKEITVKINPKSESGEDRADEFIEKYNKRGGYI